MADKKQDKPAETAVDTAKPSSPTTVVMGAVDDSERAALRARIAEVESEREALAKSVADADRITKAVERERDQAISDRDDARTARDRAEDELLELRTAPGRNRVTEFGDRHRTGGPRVRLRAKHSLSFERDGARVNVAAGALFDATREECSGLVPGENFELARDAQLEE